MKPTRKANPNTLLRQAREQKGWTQEYVATKIGATPLAIYRWERGLTFPGGYYRQQLSALFAMHPQALGLIRESGDGSVPEEIAAPMPPSPTMPFSSHYPAIPTLPLFSRRLVGRGTLLQTLKSQMETATDAAYVALVGLPGVGKTALAIELAHDADISARFGDGIVWVSLGPTPNVLASLSGVAASLNLSALDIAQVRDVGMLSRIVQRLIDNRRMLIIIDDAWNIADALAFRVGGPGCAHVVTTRFPQLAAQFAPQHVVPIPELTERDGLAMLMQLAPDVIDQEQAASRALVQAVGGLPLALALVGNYLYLQALSGQPRRIQSALALLRAATQRFQLTLPLAPVEASPSLMPGMALSLKAAIAVSEERLADSARALLRAIAIFPAKPTSFVEAAAHYVSGDAPEQFARDLDALLDAGFVESMVPGRYSLHQTIADYARLDQHNLAAQQRMVTYFAAFVAQHQTQHAVLQQELPNIVQALAWADELALWDELLRATLALTPYLKDHGLYAQAMPLLKQAKSAAHALGDEQGVAACCLQLSSVLRILGSYAESLMFVQEGLSNAHLTREQQAGFYYQRASLLEVQGQRQESVAIFEDALALAQAGENGMLHCEILSALGAVKHQLGETSAATAMLQEGLRLAREMHYGEQICRNLRGLGIIAGNAGNSEQAAAYFAEGLAIARQYGYQMLTESLVINGGIVAMNRGDEVAAEAAYVEGLTIAKKIGHLRSVNNALTNLIDLALQQDDLVKVQTYLDEGFQSARESGDMGALSVFQLSAGRLAIRQGDVTKAAQILAEGDALVASTGSAWHKIDFQIAWGYVALLRHEVQRAEELFDAALRQAQATGNDALIAEALFGAAKAAALDARRADAVRLGNASLALFEQMDNQTVKEVKRWLHEQGDDDEAAKSPVE